MFFDWTRSIHLPSWEMNIIIGCEGFQVPAVERVANVAEYSEISEVKADILIPGLVFQHLKGACPF